jgi:hypothetical protein
MDGRCARIAGYRRLLEDGLDMSNSESDAEYSDYGEELTGMYTSDMPGLRANRIWQLRG